MDYNQNRLEGTRYNAMIGDPMCGSGGAGMVNGDGFFVIPLVMDSSDTSQVAGAPATFHVCSNS